MLRPLTTAALCALVIAGLGACGQAEAPVLGSSTTTSASPTLPGDPTDYDGTPTPTETETTATSTDTETTETTDEDATDEDATSDDSEGATARVGQTVELDDWNVTVTKVTKPSTRQVRSWNMFNDKAKGQYVMVDYTAKYTGSDRKSDAQFDLSWSFTGSNDQVYDESAVVTPRDAADSPTEARKGGTIKGQVIFDVPTKAVKGGLVSVEDMTTYADFTF